MSYEPELQLDRSKNTDTDDEDRGFYEYGSIGREKRITDSGPLSWSKKTRKNAIESIGLPEYITGNPVLGCSCTTAYLHSVGEIVDGCLEADYMCDAGWHNYVVFKIFTKDTDKERQVHIDHEGNMIDGQGFTAGNLEEL